MRLQFFGANVGHLPPVACYVLWVVISNRGLRLRRNAYASSEIITVIPAYAYIKVIDTSGPEDIISGIKSNWYQVDYDGQIGWAWGGLIKMR